MTINFGMKNNSSLTIWNKYFDTVTKTEKYIRHVLIAVMWEDRKASNVLTSGGDEKANQAIIYISFPVGKVSYLKPKEWLALSTVDRASYWTANIGDLVYKGTLSQELSSSYTPSDLKSNYDDVLEVKSVDTYDEGSFIMRHWKLGCK